MKDKKYCKVKDHFHYTGEYRGAVHSIFNLKYGVHKRIPIVFRNRSNYNYYFIIKELEAKFKKQFTCLWEHTKKYITFSVLVEKEVMRINKNGEETPKIYLTCCNLLIAQGLWQAYFQIFSIILLKEFIELNKNLNMMIKNVK